jgi:hypothetical protein
MGFIENESNNKKFADICNNSLFDVWQRSQEFIEDIEEDEEATYSAFPQGMIVQYIPNGLIIMFGAPPEGEEYGEW